MDNLLSGKNPYNIDEAVADPAMFFGHSEVLAWIKESIHAEQLNEPLILFGSPGVGKSSILKQLEMGCLGEVTAVIQADMKGLPLENLSSFLWTLAEKINKETVSPDVEILVSPVEYKRFSAEPAAAFDDFVSIIFEERLEGKQLILAFDDLDILAGQSQEGYPEHEILTYLHDLLQREEKLSYIFTLNGPVDKLPEDALAPFNLSKRFKVTNFDLETTLTFLRQSALFNTSAVVGEYIYNLTGGHPGDIQRFCHELYERRRHNQLRHITLADVVAVTKQSKGINDFQTAVYRNLTEQSITIMEKDANAENAAGTVFQKRKLIPKRVSGRLGIMLFIFLIAGLAGGRLILTSVLERPEATNVLGYITMTAPSAGLETRTNAAVVPDQTISPTGTRPQTSNISSSTTTGTVTADPTPTSTETPQSPTSPALTPTDIPTPEPTQFPGSDELPAVITRDPDGMPMLLIPGDTFVMGTPESNPSAGFDEVPEHEVTISTFYMDKYEVTVAQYAAFLNGLGTYEDGCQEVDCAWPRGIIGYTSYLLEVGEGDNLTYAAMEGFENYPINHVSWYGADSYCQAMGARLPTEAEWEYAARGVDGRIYPWGNDPPDKTRAVYFSNTYDDLKPVDALPDGASPFGVFGMAGSMWEWVSDWYDPNYYSESPTENPQGPEDGEGKVVRGGAWPNNNQEDRIRSANRNWREANYFSPDLGFRCAYEMVD